MGASVMGPPSEPLSGPFQSSSQLGALTAAPVRDSKRKIAVLAGAVCLVGIGAGWLIVHLRGAKVETRAEAELAPVLIAAPSSTPEPLGQTAAPSDTAAGAASAAAPEKADTAPVAADGAKDDSKKDDSKKDDSKDKGSDSKTRGSRPRATPNSGFKPGGI